MSDTSPPPDPNTSSPSRVWAIIPAAGIGRRFGSALPKQYLSLQGKPVLAHSIQSFLDYERVAGVLVAISSTDAQWPALASHFDSRVQTVPGGAERCDSVLNALRSLRGSLADEDWVMVHDAVRPCLDRAMLERLYTAVCTHAVGGILAQPAVDTVKRADRQGCITETLDRNTLWLAQTPQMFRYGLLFESLEAALGNGVRITDEASALEWAGYRPLLVAGSARNIKITHPDDLALAEFYLS